MVFKLLFGDQRNVDLLIDFLKAVISLSEDDYSEIAVVDPHLIRKHPDKKLGILDLDNLGSDRNKVFIYKWTLQKLPFKTALALIFKGLSCF